jgi:nicotinate-nucleotide adenylyltransferase
MKIGLFFGSFNPIHIGHLILAQAILDKSEIDKIWFIVSPQNPFKKKTTLLHEFDRIDMIRAAINENTSFEASDIEFNLKKPSYTVDTLVHLIAKYPQHDFSLIMGEDNLENFHKWKNSDYILENHDLLVYPRPKSKKHQLSDTSRVKMIEAPVLDISATYIRKSIQNGKSIRYMVVNEVEELIKSRRYYL